MTHELGSLEDTSSVLGLSSQSDPYAEGLRPLPTSSFQAVENEVIVLSKSKAKRKSQSGGPLKVSSLEKKSKIDQNSVQSMDVGVPSSVLRNNRFSVLKDSQGNDLPTQVKQPKIPPIIFEVSDAARPNFIKYFKTNCKEPFLLKARGKRTHLLASNITDFNDIKNFLKTQSIEGVIGFHTYTLPTEKPKIMVMKGIDHITNTEEIKDEIESLTKVRPLAVFNVTYRRNNETVKANAFQINFPNSTVIQDVIAKAKYVLHCVPLCCLLNFSQVTL